MLLWQIVKKTLFCATIWIWGPPFLAWCCWRYLFVDPVYLPPATHIYPDPDDSSVFNEKQLIDEMRSSIRNGRP